MKRARPGLRKARLPELQPRELVLVRDEVHLHLWTDGDHAYVQPVGLQTLHRVWRPAVRVLEPRVGAEPTSID